MESIETLEFYLKGSIEETFEGNSGKVYLVKNDCTAPKYSAYKTCKGLKDDSIQLFFEEVLKWNKIKSRYIVPIYYIHTILGIHYACIRACNGSLEQFLKNEIAEVAAYNYSLQIIKGLLDMNHSGLRYHQDFNPQNILFEDLSKIFKDFPPENYDESHKFRMMISDFAMSNYYLKNNIAGKAGGKFPFKAPEQYKDSGIVGFEPDRFALGVLLCLLFSNRHPCGYAGSQVLNKNPKKIKGGWEKWSSSGARIVNVKNAKIQGLIGRLLSKTPDERPTFTECFDQIQSEYIACNKEQAEVSMFYMNYFKGEYNDVPRKELPHRHNLI